MSAESILLAVEELAVTFDTEDGPVAATQGVSFEVGPGEIVGLVGESGSGKSVTGRAILGLLPVRGTTIAGSIRLSGRELTGLPADELRRLRGADLAMIFQDPQSALHPFFTVGSQVAEAYQVHHRVGHGVGSRKAARRKAVELLELVGLPDPGRRFRSFPHQLSGGQRQRVMIAMAVCCEPRLLIADEPTTALDVTVQAQILTLLERLRTELGMAIVMITHDLGVVAELCDRAVVMRHGRVVESGSVVQVLCDPAEEYTVELMAATRRVEGGEERDE